MADTTRKTGAGSMLSGVLERAPQPKADPAVELEATGPDPTPKSRGVTPVAKPGRAPAARTARRIKGRTIYMPDDLFERVIVQAHRRDVTISDYVVLLLDRHVPDHRRVGPATSSQSETAEVEREG